MAEASGPLSQDVIPGSLRPAPSAFDGLQVAASGVTPVPGSLVSTRASRRSASDASVAHDDHPRADGAADTDAAAVVDADP